MLLPDPPHGRVADAHFPSHKPRAPERCARVLLPCLSPPRRRRAGFVLLGFLLSRPRHDGEPHFGTDRLLARAWPLAPILEQSLDAALHVSFLPAPNRRLRYLSLALDGIGGGHATRQQHKPGHT